MKKILWGCSLAFILLLAPLGRMAYAGQTGMTFAAGNKTAEQMQKIKEGISKRIKEKKNRVKLKLRNGSEVKGRLDHAGEDSFTVTDEKTGQQLALAYSDVDEVKGRGLSKGMKIGIITVAAVTATVAIIVLVAIHNFDPFKGGIVLR
jgi:sRNA-binding regulator protein Hfq